MADGLPKILLVDDDPPVIKTLQRVLDNERYKIFSADNGEDALKIVEEERPEAILLDVFMPVMGGLEALVKIKQIHPEASVVMMSGHADVPLSVQAMKDGAHDFLVKPFHPDRLRIALKNAVEKALLYREVKELRREVSDFSAERTIVGISEGMEEVRRLIRSAAVSPVLVLVRGESGTGKELVARAVHACSDFHNESFVPVNCAAIPSTLIESELFGHEKGAFTSAFSRQIGKFEQAGDGTIFLDEIGDLMPEVQAKLLRVLQEREITRVGGSELIPISARIITATHRDLEKMVEEGTFRQDLYYRLNVLPIRIPPLRERPEDIPLLCDHFLQKMGRPLNHPVALSNEALELLCQAEWPGNVRELQNALERAFVNSGGSKIDKEHLNFIVPSSRPGIAPCAENTKKILPLTEVEKEAIQNAVALTDGNISSAARALGIGRDTLYRKMRNYGINHERTSS